MSSEYRKADFNEIEVGNIVDFGFQINSTLIVEEITKLPNQDLINVSGKHYLTGKTISHNFQTLWLPQVRIKVGA
jgi:hypothetical protein